MLEAQLWLFNTWDDNHFQQYAVSLTTKYIPVGIIAIVST